MGCTSDLLLLIEPKKKCLEVKSVKYSQLPLEGSYCGGLNGRCHRVADAYDISLYKCEWPGYVIPMDLSTLFLHDGDRELKIRGGGAWIRLHAELPAATVHCIAVFPLIYFCQTEVEVLGFIYTQSSLLRGFVI